MFFNPKNRSSKIVAVSIAAAMLITVITACNIDYAGLSEGLNDLGSAVDFYNKTPASPASEETTTETAAVTTTTETSGETSATASETTTVPSETTTETSGWPSETTTEPSESATETTSGYGWGTPSETSSETTETSGWPSETTVTTAPSETTTTPEPTATETPTPTPTPTTHPSNERVDFSYLTSKKLAEEFAVDSETFSESVDAEYNKPMAVFSGKRMLVSKAGSDNVAEAINLILDSFYQEAAGFYARYSGEAKAAYNLSGTVDNVYNIEVNFDYSYNSRILSVIMSYKVTAANKVLASKQEFANFDMLTGQYLTLASVADDWAGLQNALKIKLAKNVGINRPSAITDLYVAAQQPGAQTATIEIYGVFNGQQYHTTGDMNEYAKYLNRYGKMIFGISETNTSGT